MKQQGGFTLIELVMVIVILGILAAVAIPRFFDLRGDANVAATQGVAGGLSSAAAVNFAARSANIANGNAVTDCQHVATAMQTPLPANYSITSAAVSAGFTVTCTLENANTTPSTTASFVAIGIN